MLTSLLLLTTLTGPAAAQSAHTDPPIHVWYNSDGDYTFGDRAKVYAKSSEAGYLVVLRADMNGRVRVLAPIDPQDDQHVNGGKKYELKGRGGREAFVTEDTTGKAWYLRRGRNRRSTSAGSRPTGDGTTTRSLVMTSRRTRMISRRGS